MTTPSTFAGSLLWRQAPVALLLAVSANLYAQQPMSISLKGHSEVPPVTTSATGMGQITVQPDFTVTGSLKTSGMATTVAHIHEAASGDNGPPIITLTKATDDSFVVPPNAKLTDAQYASFKTGKLYINVHSVRHPNGEIRGQVLRMEIADTPPRVAD